MQSKKTREKIKQVLKQVGVNQGHPCCYLVSELEAMAGRPGHTPSAWLLLPTGKQGLPTIDGTPVPLVNPGAALWLPRAWLENRQRAQLGFSNASESN